MNHSIFLEVNIRKNVFLVKYNKRLFTITNYFFRFPYGSGVLGTESQSDHPVAAPEYPLPSRRRKRKFSWRVTSVTECSQSCAGGLFNLER